MTNILVGIGIIAGAEIISVFLFLWLSRLSKATVQQEKRSFSVRSVVKGMLERAFLVFTLLSDLPQALTFFAALKIATRIKDDNRISNDFYLMGNLLSVTLALIYTKIIVLFLL